ncbi:hypothetical protein ACVW0P_000444 [Mucilaginibacter sp. UYNi724]
MNNRSIFILVIGFLIGRCDNGKRVKYPLTTPIDTVDYKSIKKQFNLLEVREANKSLGGLTPNYPMATALESCRNGGGNDWMIGGFICVIPKPVIKINSKYFLINNKEELKKVYAPISNIAEAMGYAILVTKGYLILNDREFKKEYKYYYTPSISSVYKDGESYVVKLFSYKAFGCSHPYSEIIFKVSENGDVEKVSERIAFEDPKDNGLCVD